MADGRNKYSNTRRRPKPATLALIVLLHILAVYGLAKAFAPGITSSVEDSVVTAFTVTVTTPEEEVPPENEQVPDEGAAGEKGKKAVARAETAPEVKRPITKKPAPNASSTGKANSSGAKDEGIGTGAAGQGDGTGSGRSGGGAGGVAIATRPSIRSGNLNTASDFPIPEGGRATRFGKRVLVQFTVTVDGRAKNCSVRQSGVDSATTALVCPLVKQKIRFNPAKSADGTPVETLYGYQVKFNEVD